MQSSWRVLFLKPDPNNLLVYLPLQKPCDPFSFEPMDEANQNFRCGTWKLLFVTCRMKCWAVFWGSSTHHKGVSLNGATPKWMVYNGNPYFLMDDLGGKPHYFRKHPYAFIWNSKEPTGVSASSPPALPPSLVSPDRPEANPRLFIHGKNAGAKSNKSKAVHNVHIYSTSCFCKLICFKISLNFRAHFDSKTRSPGLLTCLLVARSVPEWDQLPVRNQRVRFVPLETTNSYSWKIWNRQGPQGFHCLNETCCFIMNFYNLLRFFIREI